MDIKFEDLKDKFGKKAKYYANNKKKAEKLVEDAAKKAKKEGPFEDIWENIQLLFGIIKDWSKGNYTEVPKGSIIAIIIGLLYFISPIDLIPDWIPGAGLVDDAFVLGLIIKQVKSDLDMYKEWRENNML